MRSISSTAIIASDVVLPHSIVIKDYAIIHSGVILKENIVVSEYAVVGKPVQLSSLSTLSLCKANKATVIGSECVIGTHSVILQSAEISAGCMIADMAFVRERVILDKNVVVGQAVTIENDTHVGAFTKIQAKAYVTAYSSLGSYVFIAPCVVTTNDKWMGRTEKRHDVKKGAIIKDRARIGGGAILLPGVEIGEEAVVGAGSVVTRSVEEAQVVWGNPARVQKSVPKEEQL